MPSVPFANALRPTAQLFKRLATIQPHEAKLTVGLDVGSASIKTVALGQRKGMGNRPIMGQSLIPIEPGQETDASDAIKAAVSALQIPVRLVNLSVSGQWVIIRIIEMPTMSLAEIKQALPFEAQRYLPFNVQDVVLDGAVLGPADAKKTWVLVVACKKELIERRVDWTRSAGVDVALIDVDALALANAFLTTSNARSPDDTHALINVGAQLTSLVIFQGHTPYLVRDIPWGGEKLVRNAAEQMGVETDVVGKELTQGAPTPEVLNALKLSCESLVTELQLSFDYFENRFGQPPESISVSGGVGQSPLFLEALKSHLTQGVTAWAPLKGLSGQFAVAYGLALRTN